MQRLWRPRGRLWEARGGDRLLGQRRRVCDRPGIDGEHAIDPIVVVAATPVAVTPQLVPTPGKCDRMPTYVAALSTPPALRIRNAAVACMVDGAAVAGFIDGRALDAAALAAACLVVCVGAGGGDGGEGSGYGRRRTVAGKGGRKRQGDVGRGGL